MAVGVNNILFNCSLVFSIIDCSSQLSCSYITRWRSIASLACLFSCCQPISIWEMCPKTYNFWGMMLWMIYSLSLQFRRRFQHFVSGRTIWHLEKEGNSKHSKCGKTLHISCLQSPRLSSVKGVEYIQHPHTVGWKHYDWSETVVDGYASTMSQVIMAEAFKRTGWFHWIIRSHRNSPVGVVAV